MKKAKIVYGLGIVQNVTKNSMTLKSDDGYLECVTAETDLMAFCAIGDKCIINGEQSKNGIVKVAALVNQTQGVSNDCN